MENFNELSVKGLITSMEGNNRFTQIGSRKPFFRTVAISAGVLALVVPASAQVSDLLTAFDSGSRASGAGGALQGSSGDTFATLANPAGLAYADRALVQYAQKNRISTASVASGSFDDPSLKSKDDKGKAHYSHLGVLFPFEKVRRGGKGTISFSYDLGGYIDDTMTASGNLSLGTGFGVKNFTQKRKVIQDYYTFSYGNMAKGGALAYGFGLTIVNQKLDFRQTGDLVDGNGQPVGGGQDVISFPDVSANGLGLGLVGGVQYTPPNNQNRSFWASFRTPISISDAGGSAANLDVIPARLALGAAQRFGSFLPQRKSDYMVAAVQFEGYFAGSTNKYFDTGNGSALGVGVEYSLDAGGTLIPLRLGYRSTKSNGQGFSDRDGITYGIGYTPNNYKFSIDLNYFKPRQGAEDFTLTATYRF